MDAQNFDSLTRTASDRRLLFRNLGRAGLIAAVASLLGWKKTAAEPVNCTLQIRFAVRVGPSAGQLLAPGMSLPGVLEGEVMVSSSDGSNIDAAELILLDGSSYPTVGQIAGRQIAFRVQLDDDRVIVLQGVGDHPLSACDGRFDGSQIGPFEGDLGDWHAEAVSQSGADEVSEEPSTTPALTAATATETTIPSPTATAACVPPALEALCPVHLCGQQPDLCGGTVDCGDCGGGRYVCYEGECCLPGLPEDVCFPGRCAAWYDGCGGIVGCGACPAGYDCLSGNYLETYCCGLPGQGCQVGNDCCSGSCSMLNGCN